MVSSSNKGKEALKDDLKDQKAEEEKDKIEVDYDVEEDPRPFPSATVASIGVVRNPTNFKAGARMSTGGKTPRHFLAPRTLPPDTKKPFRTLIHKYQFEKVPETELPTRWDIDRSNNAGKGSPKAEEKWNNNSKSWDSYSDKMMNRIEHNSELIRNLIYKVNELKEIVEKLVGESRVSPKE